MNPRTIIKSIAVAALVFGAPTAAYANTQNFSGLSSNGFNYDIPNNNADDFTLSLNTGYSTTDVYNCGNGGTYLVKLFYNRSFQPDEQMSGYSGGWCKAANRKVTTWNSGKHHWEIQFPTGNSDNVRGYLQVPS